MTQIQNPNLESLIHQAEFETEHALSHSLQSPSYRQVLAVGEAALPTLLESLESREEPSWQLIQLVMDVARDAHHTIEYPENIQFRTKDISRIIVEWGRSNNYFPQLEA